MDEGTLPCFSCSKTAEHVIVTEDRLMLYCSNHLLERLKSSNVHTVFPVVAWKFAQTLAEFSPGLVNDFLAIEGTVRRIEAVQVHEWQLRNLKSESRVPHTSSAYIDKEALTYITAILKSVKEEANLPTSQWQNASVVLACQVLYTRYLPVLLPTGERNYQSFVSKCDSVCQQIVKLMNVLGDVKKLGEMEGGNWYFQRKTIRRMCEMIENIGNKVAEWNMEFVKAEDNSKVTLSELITREIAENCRVRENGPETKEKFTRNADFDRSAIPLWGEIADICLSSSHIQVAALAFIRKGEAYQSLQEYTEAEECYQASRDICSAETSDLKRYTLLDVRLGLLFTEKREYLRAGQHFQTVAMTIEEVLSAEELVEAYIGIAKTAIGLNRNQEAFTIFGKLENYCLTHPNLASIYIAEFNLLTGDLYLKINQPSQASDYLRRAVSLYTVEAAKEHSLACRSLGCSLDQMGRYEEAAYCYRTAVQGLLSTDPEYMRLQDRIAAIQRNCKK